MASFQSTLGTPKYDPSWVCDDTSCKACTLNSTQVSELVLDDSEKLCRRCKEIDLNAIFRRRYDSWLGTPVMNLGVSVSEWETSKCFLCKLFASVTPSDDKNAAKGQDPSKLSCYLLAYPRRVALGGQMTFLGIIRVEDPTKIEIRASLEKTGYLGCSLSDKVSATFGVRPICAKRFNIGFARECIAYCQRHHRRSCEQAGKLKGAPFFRVIDCKTRIVIVAPPNISYAALSYVWEAIPAGQIASTSLEECPKVVRDSIEVALNINLQYLWVDRYCIDQSSTGDKHDQIGQMDSIYANAQITIIAAQTKVEDTGLAGVTELRPYRPSYITRNHLIAPIFFESSGPVSRSKWGTRGWTYQEAVLSKRQLIFTDNEVFFECNAMQCAESQVLPFHSKRKAFMEMAECNLLGSRSVTIDPDNIMDHIKQFSRRDLTYQEDKLNAMKGIFRTLERYRVPTYQYMGIPIMPPLYKDIITKVYKKLPRSPEQGFLIGLTWEHDRWTYGNVGERVPYFPTWTWAGWTGVIRPILNFSKHWNNSPKNAMVYTELQDGSLSRFPGLEALSNFESIERLNWTKFIHIDAETFSCSTVRLEDVPPKYSDIPFRIKWPTRCQPVKLVVEKGTEFYFAAYFNKQLDEDEKSSKMLTGIVLGDLSVYNGGKRMTNPPAAIIFVEELDRHAERLAVGVFGWGSSYPYIENKWSLSSPEFLLECSKKFLKRRTIRIG